LRYHSFFRGPDKTSSAGYLCASLLVGILHRHPLYLCFRLSRRLFFPNTLPQNPAYFLRVPSPFLPPPHLTACAPLPLAARSRIQLCIFVPSLASPLVKTSSFFHLAQAAETISSSGFPSNFEYPDLILTFFRVFFLASSPKPVFMLRAFVTVRTSTVICVAFRWISL